MNAQKILGVIALFIILFGLGASILSIANIPSLGIDLLPRATATPVVDLARGQALWNSKGVDTYQIEVWTGGITPPPPVYVIQVWRNTVVYAHSERHYSMPGPAFQALAPDTQSAQAVTVPGLFVTAKRLLSNPPSSSLDTKTSVTLDPEWGFPKNMSSSSNCIDCVWYSQVQKFQAFDSSAPPATPTPHK